MLCAQTAAQMNLKSYPCEEVQCRFQVRTEDGETKEVYVKRHLIQLGFGDPVTMQCLGDRLDLPQTMLKAVVKLPSCYGWTPETIRGNTISTLLAQHIDIHGVESLQCREDGSATLMIHESISDAFLAASGKDSMFTKIHATDEDRKPTYLLWMPEGTSLQAAIDMASPDTLGVVVKSSKMTPRLAIRFRDEGKMSAFAKTHGLPDSSKCGRWRVDGLVPSIGSAGVVGMLQAKGWTLNEFLYWGANHCVFTADGCGATGASHYQLPGRGVQVIRFKALNQTARKQQEEESRKTRATSSKASTSHSSGHARAAFLKKLAPTVTTIDMTSSTPASPRQPKPEDKRKPDGPTGQTPPPQKLRET